GAKLKSNRARADDEKFFWHLIEAKRFGAADDGFAIEFCERQLDCRATGGDDNVFGFDLLYFASRRFYRNLSRCGDRAHPLQDHYLVCLHQLESAAGTRFHHFVLALL